MAEGVHRKAAEKRASQVISECRGAEDPEKAWAAIFDDETPIERRLLQIVGRAGIEAIAVRLMTPFVGQVTAGFAQFVSSPDYESAAD